MLTRDSPLPPLVAMDKDKSQVPTVAEMCELRSGANRGRAFAFYCFHFLPCVLGRKLWVDGMRQKRKWSTFVTLSDEAYGLLVLENLYDQWMYEYENKNKSKTEKRQGGGGPKYSTGVGREAKLMKGWSREGVERLNDLIKEVAVDRAEKEAATEEETERKRASWDAFQPSFFHLLEEEEWDPDNTLWWKGTGRQVQSLEDAGEDDEMPDCFMEL